MIGKEYFERKVWAKKDEMRRYFDNGINERTHGH